MSFGPRPFVYTMRCRATAENQCHPTRTIARLQQADFEVASRLHKISSLLHGPPFALATLNNHVLEAPSHKVVPYRLGPLVHRKSLERAMVSQRKSTFTEGGMPAEWYPTGALLTRLYVALASYFKNAFFVQ